MGLAEFVDWTRRPPKVRIPDPWRDGVSNEEWWQYEDDEAARLAPSFAPAPVSRALAVEAMWGHPPVSSPARSQDIRTAWEISRRLEWERVWTPAPLSRAALELERRSHFCGLVCWARGCPISGLPAPTANTTTDADTSRAEDASAMRK